jgi:hypothetical protein
MSEVQEQRPTCRPRSFPPRDPGLPEAVEIYDTTLRDGAQLEGISLTVDDKLRIADALDELGVQFIEGGWPGANPKDVEFFERAGRELRFERPPWWPSDPPAAPVGQGRRRPDVA